MAQSPPIACSLEREELPGRARLMAELGRELTGVEAEGRHALLRFPSDRMEDVEAFVEEESRCCPFFAFQVSREGTTARLDVDAPEGAEWAVRGLVAGFVAGWGGLVSSSRVTG